MNLKTHKVLAVVGWVMMLVGIVAFAVISVKEVDSQTQLIIDGTIRGETLITAPIWLFWQTEMTVLEYRAIMLALISGPVFGITYRLVTCGGAPHTAGLMFGLFVTATVGHAFYLQDWLVFCSMFCLTFWLITWLFQYTWYAWSDSWSDPNAIDVA